MQPLKMDLYFHGGQRKEGCLSLALFLGEEELIPDYVLAGT
jgi:hypothetical protein